MDIQFSRGNEKTFWTDSKGIERPFQASPGGCEKFLNDWDHRWVGLFGGISSGKTTSGIVKLLVLHCYNAFDSNGQPTYVQSALVEPTLAQLKNPALEMLQEIAEYLGLSYRIEERYTSFVLTDLGTKQKQSRILLRSAESPHSLRAWEVGAWLCDEAATCQDDFENPRNDTIIQLVGRLRAPKANLLMGLITTTPEGVNTRSFKFFHDDPNKPDRALYFAHTVNNPATKDSYQSWVDTWPPELHDQYLRGVALDLSGQKTYSAFFEDKNVDDTLKLDTSGKFPIHVSWDFGARGCVVLVGHYWKAKDEYHVCHEVTGLDVRKTCENLYQLWQKEYNGFKWSELHFFGDHSGSRKPPDGSGSESCFRIMENYAALWKLPRRTRIARKNPMVVDRVASTNWKLCNIKGYSAVKIHPRCKQLIKDLREQRWQDDGTSLDKGSDGSIGHASDSLGYWVHYLTAIEIPRTSRLAYYRKGRIVT